MIETRKKNTQIQEHHKITESATQTHTQNQTKDYVNGILSRGRSSSRAELFKGFMPRSQTTNVGIPSFVLSGTKRVAAALAMLIWKVTVTVTVTVMVYLLHGKAHTVKHINMSSTID